MHWKKAFDSNFLDSGQLEGKDRIVKITGYKEVSVYNSQTKAHEPKYALELEGMKPWILNKKNSTRISGLFKTGLLNEWVGKSITIYPTFEKSFGEMVEVIRVRPVLPKLTLPSIDDSRFAKMLESIKAGQYSVEKAKASFSFTPEQLKQLQQ